MLEVRALRAGYGEVEVLHGVDIDVAEREIVAVLGSNGVGKSTLNNNLSGLYVPFGGSIRFCGEEFWLNGIPVLGTARKSLARIPRGSLTWA